MSLGLAGAARLARGFAFAFAFALACAFGAAAGGSSANADAAPFIATDEDDEDAIPKLALSNSKQNETQSADGQTAKWRVLHVLSLQQSNQHAF